MPIKDGGPAFPVAYPNGNLSNFGMSLRDYFAAKAMQAILGKPSVELVALMVQVSETRPEVTGLELIAEMAWKQADAMIAQREVEVDA